MNRRPLLVLLAALLVTAVSAPAFAGACGFDTVAVFANNSIDIGNNAKVNSGDVVANDDEATVSLGGKVLVAGDVFGDFLFLGSNVTIGGTANCNNLGTCTTFTPPVFESLPLFNAADPGTEDVVLAPGETRFVPLRTCSGSPQTACTPGGSECGVGETCDARRYRDLIGGIESTAVFESGVYDFRSISIQKKGDLLFRGPTDVRVAGNVTLGIESDIKPQTGFVVPASQIVFYVGGNANLGSKSDVKANFYVPAGTLELPASVIAQGAFLGQDVIVGSKAQIQLATAFANKPPTADDRDAFTNGQLSIPVALIGSDPEGQVLTFAASDGSFGTVSVAGATATYTQNNLLDLEDSFTYTATDECGAVSAPATVRVNPPGDPNTPPDDPTTEVVANDQLCASNVAPIDCELETVEDTAVTIILTAAAPCEEVSPPEAEPCDGNGNDVPLTFSVPATTSQGGTLTGLNQGTGELQEPPGADEVPQRTASVLYTPPAGFTGVDSFTFDVEGDVDGNTVIDPSGEPNPEIDTGTVEISVATFTPIPPVEARDQRVSTPMNTPVNIALSGGAGSCDQNDPDCRPLPSAAPESPAAAPRALSRALATDDTGAAAAGDAVRRPARRPAAEPGVVTRLAAPGEDLFALDSDLDQLFAVDPADGSATSLGSTSAGPSTPSSLAFDGTKMYTIDLGGGGLYTLNVADGTPTFVCTTGLSGWQGLASDPTDEGQFYGINQSDELYRIDRTNCATTLVASGVGGLIAALEFDANGTLWGAEFGSPGSTTENAALVKINKNTGAVTIVSQCATKPCTGSDNFLDGFQGIDFATDGTLYGANTNDDSLYIIDTTDGSVTNLGPHGTPVFVKGLAFSEEVLLEAGFTILTLPSVGTLSYLNPATGTQTSIAAADLPLLLPTEEVTYTPPTGATGDPLTSFTYQQSDGLTVDSGLIELVVSAGIVIVDSCAAVGRPPGCEAEAAGAGGEGAVFADPNDRLPAARTPNLRVVVEGRGTVTSSRRETQAGSVVGLSCSGDCGADFTAGTEVVLYARTLENSVFVGWGGDCSGSEPITTVTVGRRTSCVAVFESQE